MMEKYNKALRYEIFQNGEYSFLDDLIKKSEIVFDIGGHVGYFTEYCLSLNSRLFVHFFEPIKDFLNQAKNRIKHQNIYRNNVGIMDKTGFHDFFVNQEKGMQSSIYNKTFLNPQGAKTKIILEKLDNYINKKNINKINLVKIDIEGSEFDVINNMEERYFEIMENLCIEYHIWDKSFEKKFDLMLDKLSKIYISLDIRPGKYTEKIGYIFAKK